MTTRSVATCFLFVALTCGDAFAAATTATIEGIVVDANNKMPIARANVRLFRSGGAKIALAVTRSQRDGYFTFRHLTAGRYVVEVAKRGLPTTHRTLQVGDGQRMFTRIAVGAQQRRDDKAAAAKEVKAPSLVKELRQHVASKKKYYRRTSGYGRARGLARLGSRAMPSMVAVAPRYMEPSGSREGYDHITDNSFKAAKDAPLSTFSIDVDTASYSNVRRFIQRMRRLPPADAVRIEELLNYFPYETPEPSDGRPFNVRTEVGPSPWNPDRLLARIAVQAKRVNVRDLPAANLVFLLDVSGSMHSPSKLPLLKRSLSMLTSQLRPKDRVAIVVYAGAAGLVLPSTSGAHQGRILAALDGLRAGGSTAGGAGINLAYAIAQDNFIKGGNNRVILATDGDFNVGASSDGEMVRLIERKRRSGVFLTVLGFGSGNYQDAKMQKLADKGNGNHAYIDSLLEARKVLVEEMGGTLLTIAKDVKIQVDFNPATVKGYRLIGYVNRKLAARDFNNDKKDAGELGAGHSVTALYELIKAGSKEKIASADAPLYLKTLDRTKPDTRELMTVKLRYKKPTGSKSQLVSFPVANAVLPTAQTSDDFRFAAAVAGFGMLLRNSKYKGNATWSSVRTQASGALGDDNGGYRKAFLQLVDRGTRLSRRAR